MTAHIVARFPITFDTAAGTRTHAPLIFASVGGAAPARYILDTGSDVHLVNEDLADELGLDKVPGEEGTDHSGATMPSWTVGDVPIDLQGLTLELRDCVSIPALPKFHEMGIRGVIAPQNLHPSAWTVLDMGGEELIFVEGTDEAAADYLRASFPALDLLTLKRDRNYPSVVVDAAIEGFEPLPTLVDAGGKATEFSAQVLQGLVAEGSSRLGGGVFGSDYHGGPVGRQLLLIGGRHLEIGNLMMREQMPDPHGLIGMDLLGGTVLASATDRARPVFWLVPA